MGPLHGVLVADFGRVLAAPYATMLLADLGADVVKVEAPGRGDDTRAWGPPWAPGQADGAVGDATYYLSVNRNKRSIDLDLANPADRALASELARRADVVVENLKPGGMARYGLGYDDVVATNPSVVYCSVTGFGSGAGADLPGYDLLAQAVGGLMSITGPAPGEPTKAGVAVVDVLTGLHATVAVLAALHHRRSTGEGQRVEVNLLSCLLSSLANQSAAFAAAGVVPTIMGNRHPSVVPYELYPTATEQIVLAVGNDRQFGALCAVLGLAGLAADERFSSNTARVANRDALFDLLAGALRTRSADDWFALLTPAGVPCGPVNDIAGAFALAERLGLAPVAEVGGVRTVANPATLSASPVTYRRPPPGLGEHAAELRAWLAAAPDRTAAG
ncbi:MAG TPA: CoA transferase [Acidimicrobiales bacterium]|nr:CoA transferase [Acidimicrobiales bacterium]